MNATDLFSSGRKKARVEIIPLIDVVFFLLATFVLFVLSLDKISSMSTPLPKAGRDSPQDTTVFIQASDGGACYWKQGTAGIAELVSAAEIPAKLTEYKHRVAEPRVLIRGDNQAKFGAAVQLLDQVRQAGIEQVSVETLVSRSGT